MKMTLIESNNSDFDKELLGGKGIFREYRFFCSESQDQDSKVE